MGSSSQIYRRILWSGMILLGILVVGTFGYWWIGGEKVSFIDAVYMTVITLTTIGYGEIIDLSHNPVGRLFTIFIAISGVGILLYVITNATALLVEGYIMESFKRRKMEKLASVAKEHYIICGLGSVGSNIVDEFVATKRPFVIVDTNRKNVEKIMESYHNYAFVEGDATDNSTLVKAGIERARGLFAVTSDDNQNIIVSLTAKQLNPGLRVVARCNETKNVDKMRKAGADAVVSPTSIGGLRMASEMVRPTVVSFLDIMLRDKQQNLRVEEVFVPADYVGRPLSGLELKKYPGTLLLAVRNKEDWVYNPPESYIIQPENTLVLMTTPGDREELTRVLSRRSQGA
jgi:voltage-gated potassium channel